MTPPLILIPADTPEPIEFRLAPEAEPAGDVVVPLVALLTARWRRRERLAAQQAAGGNQ